MLLGFVLLDLALVRTHSHNYFTFWRYVLALGAGLCWLVSSFSVGREATGLVLVPRHGWKYWLVITVILGAITLAMLAAAIAWVSYGNALPENFTPYIAGREDFVPVFVAMCISAPLIEEVLYRACLCPPCVAFVGPKFSIVMSGLVFATLHVLYGNPSPENLLGGFVLGWAFLKSETLLVPLMLHSLGNFSVLIFHAAYWWLSD